MFRAIKVFPSMLLLAAFGLLGCKDAMLPGIDEADLLASQHAIVNGERVLGNDMLSTVALVMYGTDVFCTGTLISPNYVLTAAHCISDCDDDDPIAPFRPKMSVGIGQGDDDIRRRFEIEAFYPHKGFICSDNHIANDIALLKLKTPVPLSLVTPTPPMPPHRTLTVSEVNASKVSLLVAGFGRTGGEGTSGKKYKAFVEIAAMCSLERGQSKRCSEAYMSNLGFLYHDVQESGTGTCKGDSGGPMFMTRNEIQYVIGVTSYGYGDCLGVSASTLVSDYYPFISGIATDIAAGEPENCSNKIDDNGDGRIDCDDPYCFSIAKCIPEDCSNGVDDNSNGLIDCKDAQCAGILSCQKEICNNGIDDNGNGDSDCFDPECYSSVYCAPENCVNGVDDNANGLVDCDDAQCRKTIFCKPEVCSNGVDDNKNGLIDCADPTCAKASVCLPEICDNRIDDNGDGKVDCDDVKCVKSDKCRVEDCRNGIDDTGNGLIDCLDPSCATSISCKVEICDNRLDDNANKLQDCDDPACAESPLCVVTKEGSPSTCSASPRGLGPVSGGGFWALVVLLALAFRRRSSGTLGRVKGEQS